MPYSKSLIKDIRERIQSASEATFVIADFGDLSDRDQILRALRGLIQEEVLIRVGYGVYVRAKRSRFSGKLLPVDLLAFEKICQGKQKEARTILTGNKNASCQNMLLGLDYLEQKSGTKEIFAENLKQFKKENRKRKDFFRDIGGAFYGIQLLVDEEKELYRLFGYPLKHDLPFQLESLYNLLQVAASYQETGAFSYEDSYFLRKTRDSSNDPITSFFAVLVYAWFDRKLLSTDILLPLHIQYREKGLMWFVAETAIMLKEIGHQDLVEPALLDFFKRNNLRSLTELITPKEEWEQTLDILLREFQAPPKEEVSKPRSLFLLYTHAIHCFLL